VHEPISPSRPTVTLRTGQLNNGEILVRGRKPTPTALKILKGVQNDRINHPEPVPPSGRPEPPEHLDKVAKEEWGRICELLEGMGLLSLADGPALVVCCECYSKWLRARGEIAKHGLMIKTTTDVIKKNRVVATKEFLRINPAINVEVQMGRMTKELLIEFGLTPSARSRIRSSAPRPQDALERFLAENA
jgi:P27 family predicted phage terminase small subunit